jgi:hypothetical protein
MTNLKRLQGKVRELVRSGKFHYDLRRDTKKPASGFTMRPFGMSSIASAKERLVR